MPREIEVGQELLNVPMGEMIQSMASAIADAQWDLDKSSMVVAEMMSGQRLLRDLDTGALLDFSGNEIEPLRDFSGNVERDERGEPVYDPQNGPRVIDSRTYFGYTYEPLRDSAGNTVTIKRGDKDVTQMRRIPNRVSMLELGFSPTFYQFVDTIIEVKMAIKMTAVQKSTWGYGSNYSVKTKVRDIEYGKRDTTSVSTYSSSVDASYSNKYGYSVEGSSLLRTKMVPIPPPAMLQERIRQVMEAESQYLDALFGGEVEAVESETAPAETAPAETAPAETA